MLKFVVFLSLVNASLAFAPISTKQTPATVVSVNAGASASVGATEETNDRRSFLSNIMEGTIKTATAATVLSSNPIIANAEEDITTNDNDILTLYKDTKVGFQVQVPNKWKKSEQSLPDRRKLLLFINEDGTTDPSMKNKGMDDLVFVAYTPVRDDFTSLGSFGTVEQVGQATILPKGTLAGQETENKMIKSESKKNAYYFDYTSKSPDQPKRHFRTIFTMVQGATGGAGSVLVTITAQTLESRYDSETQAMFDQIIDSYKRL